MLIIFVVAGSLYIDTENWQPFVPPSKSLGEYGFFGVLRGSAGERAIHRWAGVRPHRPATRGAAVVAAARCDGDTYSVRVQSRRRGLPRGVP